jgi:hypothetical protein
MIQAISGVTPASVHEVTTMTVWPSIAVYPDGRWLGRLYSNKAGFWVITVGNLLALASIPHALFRYFFRLATGKSYKLTNRRVIELGNRMGFRWSFPFFLTFQIGRELRWVDLDRFDTIDLVRQPGQEWFDAGDLIFKLGNVETFRLEGVSRPESFRQTCLKSRAAFVGVKQALLRQAVPA